MLKAIIIDDELRSRESLAHIVAENCNNVQIVELAESVETGVKSILKNKPDLIFLDIEMQDGTGFDLLEKMPNGQFDVIFT
ncbi:MAG: response regulator, partial [Bacteroidetes bacterium]|nr:response regulator [Bacteroidota bacterium]